MKLQSIGAALNFLLFVTANLSTRVFALSEERAKYNVVHPTIDPASDDYLPFSDMANIDSTNAECIMHTAKQDISTMYLTPSEAAWLQYELVNEGGSVALDGLRWLPTPLADNTQNLCVNATDTELDLASTNETEPRTAVASPYLTSIPRCGGVAKGVEVILLDTAVNTKNPELKGVTITHGSSSISNTPCNPHSTEVASIIFGKKYGVIPHGNRMLYNYPVFECGGKTTSSVVINGINDAILRNEFNKKRGVRTVINLSITGGGHNDAENVAANAAVDAGITFVVSAGNDGFNVCTHGSPADASKVFNIGGTVKPGNAKIWFSNFGPCVKMYLPGSVKVSGKVIQGTSFSCPQGVALSVLHLGQFPNSTPLEVQQAIVARTVTVNDRYAGAIKVMQKQDACPPKNSLRAG